MTSFNYAASIESVRGPGKSMTWADPKREARYIAHRDMLDAYKLARGCIDCGYNAHPAALEFDHRDRDSKVVKLAAMFTYTPEKVFAELEKCDVRCSNCHRIKTFEDGESGYPPEIMKAMFAKDED